MREIKFRAWIYDRTNKRGKMYHAKDFGDSDASLFNYFSERCADGVDFLMQYINRKDKNKIEIYEGDKWQSPSGKIYIVKFGEQRDYESGEVIGNIHDKE